MRLGQAAMEALRAEITGCLKPGDELLVACPAPENNGWLRPL